MLIKIKLSRFIKEWISYKDLIGLKSRSIVILLTMSFFTIVSETLGLGIFYPVVEFIQANEDISVLAGQSKFWTVIVDIYSIVGVTVSLETLLLSALLMFTGRQLFLYVKTIYQARLRFFLYKKLRNSFFRKYLHTNTDYQDSMPIGEFSEIVAIESASSVSGILTPIELVSSVVMLVVFFLILVLISWQMTIVAFIVIFITSMLLKVWIKQTTIVGRKVVAADIELNSFLVNRIRSLRLVRLSGTERAEITEFNAITEVQCQKMVEKVMLKTKADMVMEPVVIALSLAFVYFSVALFGMSLGEIGLYMIISMRLLPVVKAIIKQLQTINGAIGSIEVVSKKINEMNFNQEVNDGHINNFNIKKNIEFDSVYFRYPSSNKYVLSNITFKIPLGKITAIVGPSGSGKSTLIDLLPRLRDTTSGCINFDNISINKFNIGDLRAGISYASQNPQIFNVTIAEHIKYGKPDATMDEVIYAAELSGLSKFVDTLQFGYDTLLGDSLIRLSGGQQQKLELARVIISNPKILILDEPTSSLDPESEKEFEKIFFSLKDNLNITILIISHSLGLVSNADQIIVLNQGRIESTGKHTDLLNSSSWYKKAWNIQKK